MNKATSICKKLLIVCGVILVILIGIISCDSSDEVTVDDVATESQEVVAEEPVLLGYYTLIGFEQTESKGYWEFYSDYTVVEVNTPVQIEKWNNGGVILFSETLDFDGSDDDIDRVYGARISEETGWQWETVNDLEQAPIEFQTFLALHCIEMNEAIAEQN